MAMREINEVMLIGVASNIQTRGDKQRFKLTTQETFEGANQPVEAWVYVVAEGLVEVGEKALIGIYGHVAENRYTINGAIVNRTEVQAVNVFYVNEETPHLNTVVWHGMVAAEPDLRFTAKGREVCTLSLVQGDRQAGTSVFLRVTFWGKGGLIAGRLRKLAKVAVKGRLSARTYDNRNGQKVTVLEAVGLDLKFDARTALLPDEGAAVGKRSEPVPAGADDLWADE